MEDKLERKTMRARFSSLGWALLLYLLILNACVSVGVLVDMVLIYLRQGIGEVFSEEQVNSILMSNGWGYLVTIAIGLICLRVWKGKAFFRQTLWTRGKPMKLSDFLILVCLFLSGQLAFQVVAALLEAFLNLFGLSAMADIETATMSADTLSMFLYAGIGAPIAEEILFRGLVLRQLEPYGKRFAIVLSAFLFGIFHGNLVQIPYAFLVGLVLGYVAIEYNIVWAMVLHMINNLVLADMISRLTMGLPDAAVNVILNTIIWGCALVSFVVLLVRRKEALAYVRAHPLRGTPVGTFFSSAGIIVLIVLTALSLVGNLVTQALPG